MHQSQPYMSRLPRRINYPRRIRGPFGKVLFRNWTEERWISTKDSLPNSRCRAKIILFLLHKWLETGPGPGAKVLGLFIDIESCYFRWRSSHIFLFWQLCRRERYAQHLWQLPIPIHHPRQPTCWNSSASSRRCCWLGGAGKLLEGSQYHGPGKQCILYSPTID